MDVFDKLTTQDAWNVLALRINELADDPEDQGLTGVEAIVVLDALRETIDGALLDAIDKAHREGGYTIAEIARALGVTRQAVWNRLDRLDRAKAEASA